MILLNEHLQKQLSKEFLDLRQEELARKNPAIERIKEIIKSIEKLIIKNNWRMVPCFQD